MLELVLFFSVITALAPLLGMVDLAAASLTLALISFVLWAVLGSIALLVRRPVDRHVVHHA